MNHNFLRAILFIALMPTTLSAQPSSVLLLGEGRDNVMQNWEVAREKWGAQPKWTPSSAKPPPLSIAKAVEASELWLRKRQPDLTKLAVSQIVLRMQSASGSGIQDGWFYRVEFQPIVAGKKVWGADLVSASDTRTLIRANMSLRFQTSGPPCTQAPTCQASSCACRCLTMSTTKSGQRPSRP